MRRCRRSCARPSGNFWRKAASGRRPQAEPASILGRRAAAPKLLSNGRIAGRCICDNPQLAIAQRGPVHYSVLATGRQSILNLRVARHARLNPTGAASVRHPFPGSKIDAGPSPSVARRNLGRGLPQRSARGGTSFGMDCLAKRARNKHPKATTILVVPFSATLSDHPTHIRLASGRSGLPAASELQPEPITAVRKEYLKPRPGTRAQPESLIKAVAKNVVFSLGVQPKDIQ